MIPSVGWSLRREFLRWLYHPVPHLLSLGIGLTLPSWGQSSDDLWSRARTNTSGHHFSTLFTAQDVRDRLNSSNSLASAVDWCKQTAVTKVYLETFRDGYQADQKTIDQARRHFQAEGFAVSGCVTTTRVGKSSTGWKDTISCYTDPPTQNRLQTIFEFAAHLFDEIMIDDFWFTDCTCPECDAARKAKTVSVGPASYPVADDSWAAHREELMVRLSRDRILAPARRVNPKVQMIIKYPQWYDRFHERGYAVDQETRFFDRIWVGTETRDYQDARWGGTVPYEAYFIMRWLGGIGGDKCGGGWYDWLGTTEKTYLEQARQTILGGARESLLFCYGGLQRETGPKNVLALRAHQAELFQVAHQVQQRAVIGIAVYKPIGSPPETEPRVFDFVGMLGLPLVPGHQFPTNAPAAFFSLHALKDPAFKDKLAGFVKNGRPTLITDGLRQQLTDPALVQSTNLHVLTVSGNPKSLLELPQDQLDQVRTCLLAPFSVTFKAPHQVGLYLFADGSWVIENFNDQDVSVSLNQASFTVPARGWKYEWKN